MYLLVLVLLPLVLGLGGAAAVGSGFSGREAVLVAALGWGAFIGAATETLSLFHALNPTWLAASWLAAAGTAGYCGRRHLWRRGHWRPVNSLATWAAALVMALMLVELVVALSAAPGTWDSMTYHLARVEHWRQQGSVSFYPTSIDRQLYSAPWSEFAVAHLRILAGSDRLVNLVQWLAAGVTALAVSLVTQRLGGDRRAQALSAVVVATIPMGVLQATSTQTDYTVSLWIAVSVWAILRDLQRPSTIGAVLIALAVGLAALTKGTAIVLLAPAGLLWVVLRAKALGVRSAPGFALVLVLPCLLNSGQWVRNIEAFGSPLAPSSGRDLVLNHRHSVGVVSSNLMRDGAMNLATSVQSVNTLVNRVVVASHEAVGVSVNDPSTTFAGTAFGVAPSRNEDTVGNPLHFVMAIISGGLLLLHRPRRSRQAAIYASSLLASCVLFSWQLRWQPWITRLELPLFVMAGPMAGLVLARVRRPLAAGVVCALVVPAMLLALVNDDRPLLGRHSVLTASRPDSYFAGRPELQAPYLTAMSVIRRRGVTRVGLVLGADDWEYPFWVGLPGVMLESGRTADYTRVGLPPPHFDALVCTTMALECQPRAGWARTESGAVTVLIRFASP